MDALHWTGVHLAVVGRGDLASVGGSEQVEVSRTTEAGGGSGINLTKADSLSDGNACTVVEVESGEAIQASAVGVVDSAVGNRQRIANVVEQEMSGSALNAGVDCRITNTERNDGRSRTYTRVEVEPGSAVEASEASINSTVGDGVVDGNTSRASRVVRIQTSLATAGSGVPAAVGDGGGHCSAGVEVRVGGGSDVETSNASDAASRRVVVETVWHALWVGKTGVVAQEVASHASGASDCVGVDHTERNERVGHQANSVRANIISVLANSANSGTGGNIAVGVSVGNALELNGVIDSVHSVSVVFLPEVIKRRTDGAHTDEVVGEALSASEKSRGHAVGRHSGAESSGRIEAFAAFLAVDS